MIATATSTTALPSADERSLVPCLLKREDPRVDETTDTDIGVPLTPITELHPVGEREGRN